MLSFISEFCFVYLMNHGIDKFIQNNGEAGVSELPSGNILVAIFLIIMIATVFVYAMIITLQGIMVKHELNVSDPLKIALQIFSKRVFVFIGAFLLSMIVMTVFTMFLQYIGIFLAILLLLTVMPAVLLAQKGIFESFSANFCAVKDIFFICSEFQ